MWWPTVTTAALEILGSETDAEDTAERVFVRLWKNGGWWDIENPASYFRRAGRREAVSLLRARPDARFQCSISATDGRIWRALMSAGSSLVATVAPILTVAVGLCSAHAAYAQESSDTLAGIVFDEVTGRPVVGAIVTLIDYGMRETVASDSSRERGRFAVPISNGRFWLIAASPGFVASPPLAVEWDSAANRGGDGILLRLRSLDQEGSQVRATPEGSSGAARVIGRVLDHDSGKPIRDADVEFAGLRTATDANGMFVLRDVPSGTGDLRLDHLAYAEERRRLTLEPGQSYHVVGRLSAEPIEVEGIEITAKSRTWFRNMDGLRWRMQRSMGGAFVLADDLESRGYPPVAEALRIVPSVRVRRAALGRWFVHMQHCDRGGRYPAQPIVYVDGIKTHAAEATEPLHILSEISSQDIEAIEVYRGGASVPPEYGGSDAACGVIVIWTKRG